MIKKITYKIRFPFGAAFDKDINILFLKKIYREIQKSTCFEEGKCGECNKKHKCIYYLLSGENFSKYPSICIDRNIANKMSFCSNDTIEISFYLIGIACNYSEFITSLFENDEYIAKQFYQKVLLDINLLDCEETYDGIMEYQNVITDYDDIIKSINYYNDVYHCNFSIPTIEEVNYIMFCDNKKYIFNNEYVRIKGKLSKVKVKNYHVALMKSGVGKYGFLGGGKSKCVLK